MRRPFFLLMLAAFPALGAPKTLPETLWDAWPDVRVYKEDPANLRHAELRSLLTRLSRQYPDLFRTLEEGTSTEGRSIPLLALGDGPRKVLLWSQMHGDEPTATAALLDVVSYLGKTRGDPSTKALLSKLTIYLVPMLNPDGAERQTRRSALEIDVNRDALFLATPEGRFLKDVRDRYQPAVGYNLHNQSPLTQAGEGGKQAALSVLSVPFDEALTEDDRTRLTKRLAVRVRELVAPFAEGRVSRYDMDYTARAFGDSMTRWGTATLLIESGGWHGTGEPERLVTLNFIAILGTLSALADGSIDRVDAGAYAKIPVNARDRLFHLLVRNGWVLQPRLPAMRADVAFLRPTSFAGERPRRTAAAVAELGDLGTFTGVEEFDATGLLLVPWETDALNVDALVTELSQEGLSGLREGSTLTEKDLAASLSRLAPDWRNSHLAPGFTGSVLLYRRLGGGALRLTGTVHHGFLSRLPEVSSK